MDNIVIKVLTREHGERVIEYFKSIGVPTRHYEGKCSLETRGENGYIYYGIINGHFDNYTIERVNDKINDGRIKLIVLSEELEYEIF